MLAPKILLALFLPLLLTGKYQATIRDGIYLYGEVAKPYQIGKDYLILRSRNGQIDGALYRPNAEYYCFSGEIKGRQMELSFVDPDNGAVFRQEIDIATTNEHLASKKLQDIRPSLDGFVAIEKLSELDYEIINSCSQRAR